MDSSIIFLSGWRHHQVDTCATPGLNCLHRKWFGHRWPTSHIGRQGRCLQLGWHWGCRFPVFNTRFVKKDGVNSTWLVPTSFDIFLFLWFLGCVLSPCWVVGHSELLRATGYCSIRIWFLDTRSNSSMRWSASYGSASWEIGGRGEIIPKDIQTYPNIFNWFIFFSVFHRATKT